MKSPVFKDKIRELAKLSSSARSEELLNELIEMVDALDAEYSELEALLAAKSVKATSRNSSLPPSKDITQSRRKKRKKKKGGRKPGGQLGHKGTTLEMKSAEDVDEVTDLVPQCCDSCGTDLIGQPSTIVSEKQVIDIEAILPLFIKQYNQHTVVCPCCDKRTKANWPAYLPKSKVSYGWEIAKMVAYLSTRQYISMDRIVELIEVLTGQKLSGGTIRKMIKDVAESNTSQYEQLRQQIMQSSVVGGDEKTIYVNGEKQWLWVWQTAMVT